MFWIMTLPSQITIFIAILIEWTNILLLIKKLLHFQWCVMCFRASDLKVSSWDSALVRRASTNTNEAGNHSLTLTRKHTTSPASSSCIYIHVRQWMCTRTLRKGSSVARWRSSSKTFSSSLYLQLYELRLNYMITSANHFLEKSLIYEITAWT